MKDSKGGLQLGFKKRVRVNKENQADSINRILVKKSVTKYLDDSQTENLLSDMQTHPQRTFEIKHPLRKRLKSYQECSLRQGTKSFLSNISHRSKSKSKLDQKLQEMLINQKVKESVLNQRQRSKTMQLVNNVPKTEKSRLEKSVLEATLSNYIKQPTQQANSSTKKLRGDDFVTQQLCSIVSLIDGIFGVNRSQKLVSSYREEKCLSIPSLLSIIKSKLQCAAKEKIYLSSNL